jgi:hypothetical protein
MPPLHASCATVAGILILILILIVVVIDGCGDAAGLALALLVEVGGLGREKLSRQIALGRFVGVAALAGSAVLEVRVCREEALVVGRSSEGFLASSLRRVRLMSRFEDRFQ